MSEMEHLVNSNVVELQKASPMLPSSFDDTVKELSGMLVNELTSSMSERVWREALWTGANVVAASEGKITPHHYDARMEEFYRSTDAFVIETVVESQRPGKKEVMRRLVERIRRKIAEGEDQLNVLMLGDGSGGDTIFLAREFGRQLHLAYFDVPGSITFEFAMKRFARYGIRVEVLTHYDMIPRSSFDVLVSLEVLEHLPDPVRAVRDMRSFLKADGIALVTESFNGVKQQFPTHLASNLRFHGMQYVLFTRHGFFPTYMHGKPMEFIASRRVFTRLLVTHPKLAIRYVMSMFAGPLSRVKTNVLT